MARKLVGLICTVDLCQSFALFFLMIYTEILLIRDNYAIQCNNMTLLIVTVKKYEVRVHMLIVLLG